MKTTPFVVVLLAAASCVTAQRVPNPEFVDVQIIVGTADALKKPCELAPTTVFVVGTQAYHCIGKKLVSHTEGETNAAFANSYVRVSVGQRVRWQSETHAFTIAALRRHAPLNPGTPAGPFSGEFPDKPAKQVTSGPVVNLDGVVEQRYKVSFDIVGVGLVDPDVVCSM